MDQPDKTINLALQGGGAHGAFAWGVVDRLLEDERISVEGISATSAGAMNAAVMAYGMTVGGREGAKRLLAEFWEGVSRTMSCSPLQYWQNLMPGTAFDRSPAFLLFDTMTRVMSPYQLNPSNYNPLRDLLERTVDFERLRQDSTVKLFLCATNVRTGKVKIFENRDITASAVLASSCLPMLFQAVEIDGEAYWDGGYMGNPAIFPLIYNCRSTDVVIVHINPIERDELPRTATEILNRLNEISFNSSLMREMRAIAFVGRLIDSGAFHNNQMKHMLMHAIEADDFMKDLGVASKFNADWTFLMHLRDVGRNCAEEWLERNYESLGVRTTMDIQSKYL
jgi:NTE family protein